MESYQGNIVFDKKLKIEALTMSGPIEKIPSHFHDYYEIGFIERGHRRVLCQNNEYVIGNGDLLLFNPKDSHTCWEMEKNILDYRCFHIDITRMKQITLECLGYELEPYFEPQIMYHSDLIMQMRELHYLVMELSDELQKEELFYLVFGNLLWEFLYTGNDSISENSLVVERACYYMEQHYKENITLEELSDYTGFSKYHFIRTFTKEKGISPFRFIESLKMVEAKRLLKNGRDIIDVTFTLGFNSQSHFTNFFKKYAGVTPKQYKQLYRD